MSASQQAVAVRTHPVARYALALFAAVAVVLAVVLTLPQQQYLRFAALHDTDYIKAGWIWRRLHADPTPVDVAFIGTSHTLQGVDGEMVEQGSGLHVANLALPHLGRDLHWLIGRMAIETKHPRVLVLEAQNIEYRAPHPAFIRLAGLRDFAGAPVFVNPDFFDNLFYLPGRQLDLFLETAQGEDVPADPVPPHWNDTYRITGRGGVLSPPRTQHPPPERFQRDVARELRVQAQKAHEYAGWQRFLWRYNMIFLQRLLDLARQSGVRVVILYLPAFGSPPEPVDAALFRRYGEIWTPPAALMTDPTLWNDPTHFNWEGAKRLSAWLGERLAAAR